MKEQSHKDEMSAALRGDFERLRKRGVSATLAPAETPPAEEPNDEPAEMHAPESEQAVDVRPGLIGRLFGR